MVQSNSVQVHRLPPSFALRALAAAYAVGGYAAFFLSFGLFVLATMGYLTQWGLSFAPRFDSWLLAIAFDFTLVLAFGVQHSVMARPWFKRRLIRFVAPPLERTTYVWASNVMLALLALTWAEAPGHVWNIHSGGAALALWGAGVVGWLGVAGASFLIDHWELFGLRQVAQWLRQAPRGSDEFRTPGAYRAVRHPMMLAMVVGLWCAPEMNGTRFALALLMSSYVVAGIKWEERDLIRQFGPKYRAYQRRVPALFPRLWRPAPAPQAPSLSSEGAEA